MKQTPRKKVLIVEDEGDMCLLMNIILNDEQMELEHVKSLSGAAAYLHRKNQTSFCLITNYPTDLE